MGKSSVEAVDLYCGAGGTSTGLSESCKELNLKLKLLAINHWDLAIETHSANHPDAKHLLSSVDNVDPRKAIPSGYLRILIASPECTHHSNARGGKPMSDQSRASGWIIVRWAEALYIEDILIENVKEFMSWGPLGKDGRPMKSKKGEMFKAFIEALRSLGYNVDYKVLNAANYGDPQTRERLFIIARRGRKKIEWPTPTHSPTGGTSLFGKTKKWAPARNIIDWSIEGKSIFNRKKPLADTTLARIVAGLQKFGGKNAEPFLVVLRNHCGPRSLKKPLPTLTTGGNMGLCQPFLLPVNHGKDKRTHSLDKPMPTVTTVDDPLTSITTKERHALVEPFILGQQSQAKPRSVNKPLPTVASAGAIALVEPYIVRHGDHGSEHSVDDPMPTVTTKDNYALVEPLGYDIRFRMLQPHELALAQSFPRDYKFSGNRKAKVKQIGNAVPTKMAQALCTALLRKAQ